MTYTIQPFGEKALLITLPLEIAPSSIGRALVTELGVNARVGIDTVLVTGTNLPDITTIEKVISHAPTKTTESSTNPIEIPVFYDGEDLAAVAQALSMSTTDVVTAHKNITWQVALVGFAPGFPYLVPSDSTSPFSQVPRLATPRTHVPAGSVAVAAGMSAVYPNAMPGGWMLLGRTTTVLFDTNSEKPSLLTAGDTVRFVEVHA